MDKLFIRKQFYTFLALIGTIVSLYLVLEQRWFVAFIAVIFSFVAGYNITCAVTDKKI